MEATMKPKQLDARLCEVPLVERARQGDPDSFSELVRMVTPRLHSVALRVLRNRADAEDVVQIALWKAFGHLPEYRHEATFSTWLVRITLNEALGLLRKRRVTPTEQADARGAEREDLRFGTETLTPEQILAAEEESRLVHECIGSMPLSYKSVLWLRVLNELSYEEIAQELNLTLVTVKVRLHRARRMLEQRLTRRVRSCSDRRSVSRVLAARYAFEHLSN